LVDLVDGVYLCPFVSCGEIGTEFGVESFKQSLFHRNLWKGMKKAEALERVSAFVTRGDIIR
jgi:hypothetical protein